MDKPQDDNGSSQINEQINKITQTLPDVHEKEIKNRQIIVLDANGLHNQNIRKQLTQALTDKGYQVVILEENELRNGTPAQQKWLQDKIEQEGLPFALIEKLRKQFAQDDLSEITDFLDNPILPQLAPDVSDSQESYRIKGQDYPDGQYYHRFKKKF